ncbi:MAG: ABC transporter permease [Chloroflexi bacterium]|nr:ABC transporter permease [Chloroflexota bacterium]
MAQVQTQQDFEVRLAARNSNLFLRVLLFIRNWPILPIVILAVMVFVAVLAPLVSPHDPLFSNLRSRNAPPVWYPDGTWTYALGADTIGRDLLSRLFYGARISLMVMAFSLVFGTIIGTALGLIAGYFGGFIDEVIMRLVDIFLGLPFVLVAMVLALVLGTSLTTMIIVLAVLTWAGFVRNVRGEVLSLRERDYVALARIAGASLPRILLMHILPGVINTVLVIATLRSGQLILAESFLSFLGAGIPPPTPTWGSMIADGRNYLRDAWWISFFPGVAIFLTVMALNFIGDWLRDKLDPRLRQLT